MPANNNIALIEIVRRWEAAMATLVPKYRNVAKAAKKATEEIQKLTPYLSNLRGSE